ncbi:hypothetical protein WA026_018528 [Henosepilachna vigintioctopunctata]|uniref:Uncharacterized protein n=1 Tax=Henosepilachna vigintioctopunctata TaxID=420089 RepID=A0AAW1UBI6_9CUCU
MLKVVALLCVISVVVVHSKPGNTYTTKFDNVNIDDILKSDRLINSYFKCLMTGRGCTPDGAELRRVLPDALKSACSKCSQKQKEGSKKIIHFMIEKKRNLWDQVEKKFDPQGVYRKKYEAEIKKEKLAI